MLVKSIYTRDPWATSLTRATIATVNKLLLKTIIYKDCSMITIDFVLISGYLPTESYIELDNLCYHAIISSKKKCMDLQMNRFEFPSLKTAL